MSETPNTPDEASTVESAADSALAPTPEHVLQDCARAPLNPKWTFKLVIITVFVLGFGVLGLYDATIKYPKRGERYADWAKWQYLEAAKSAGTEQFGIFEREASVADPAAELARLNEEQTRQRNATDAQNQSSSRHLRAEMYNTRRDWLSGLKTIGQLTPERTTIDSSKDELEALKTKWASETSNPKPLKGYDIPSQWGILFVCGFVGIWMLIHIIKVMGQKFSWEASTKTITVPGPITIAASDLEEVDKRKWDKFIVFLNLKDTHASHGGKEIKVDTYQHGLVEDWILAMEADAIESGEQDSQEDGE